MLKRQSGAALEVRPGRALDGRYRLEGEIGAGGLGIVYRATHEKLAKPVAVKLLHAHCGDSDVVRSRFEREAKALAALEHPNIVSVTDFGVADDTPYLVMELLEGETLAKRLERGVLPLAAAEFLAQALLHALAFVHGRGLVHRDVKPGNVFLQRLADGSERLKLLDFGLAKFTGERPQLPADPTLTRAGAVVGTPAYMSPEQASGEVTDARSDVYAAGVILLQMLAGRLPYTGDAIEQLRSHLIAPVPTLQQLCPNRGATPELDAFIARALAKRREDRFADAGEMVAALQALPKPWVVELATEGARELGHAATLLASNATTLPAQSASRPQPSATPRTATRPRRARRRASRTLLGLSLLVLSAAGYLAWRSDSASGRMAALSKLGHHATDALAKAAAAIKPKPMGLGMPATPAQPAATQSGDRARPVRGAAQTQSSGTDAQAQRQADDSVRHTAPIESESDEVAPPPSDMHKPRARARNPWRRSLPKFLRSVRTAVRKGNRGTDHTIALLRRYNRQHPNDVRGHLLLAGLYLNRNWRADVVNQYAIAYHIDPSSRGAPEELPNLLSIVAHGASASDAERFIEQAYRAEALPAIARALRKKPDARARARLQALRSRVVAH